MGAMRATTLTLDSVVSAFRRNVVIPTLDAANRKAVLDVAGTTSGRVADLSDELEVAPDRITPREPQHLAPNLDGQSMAIQIRVSLR